MNLVMLLLLTSVQQEIDEGMPDFANMTEEEQIAFAMQMSMQDQRNSFEFFLFPRPLK